MPEETASPSSNRYIYKAMEFSKTPFAKAFQLNNDLDHLQHGLLSTNNVLSDTLNIPTLPGHPQIKLKDHLGLVGFLENEFCSADLDAMAPHLWVMSTQSSANIEALHRQRVKGREIIVAEEPGLHLVWFYNRIFIKPIPKYLLSYCFWEIYLRSNASPLGDRRHKIRRAALGFLRTYAYLIQHESDFAIAQSDELLLVPKLVTWSDFCAFTSEFKSVKESEVSLRYTYGELRLTRLNLYIKLFLRKRQFFHIQSQYSEYFARFYGPLLFLFGVLSIILSAMQVEMAVEQIRGVQWRSFQIVCKWLSTISLVWSAVTLIILFSLFSFKILDEWVYAIKDRRRRKGSF